MTTDIEFDINSLIFTIATRRPHMACGLSVPVLRAPYARKIRKGSRCLWILYYQQINFKWLYFHLWIKLCIIFTQLCYFRKLWIEIPIFRSALSLWFPPVWYRLNDTRCGNPVLTSEWTMICRNDRQKWYASVLIIIITLSYI